MRRQPLRQQPHPSILAGFAAICLMQAACSARAPEPEAHLVIDFPSGVVVQDIELEPRSRVERARLIGSRLVLTVVAPGKGQLSVRAPSVCPLTFDLARLGAGTTSHHRAHPWIDLGAPRADLGPGAQVHIEVRPGCVEAEAGSIAWTPVEGIFHDLRSERRGFSLSGRMPALHELFELPLPRALIPVSPRNQGRVVLEARFTLGDFDQRARLELSALSRSRGLPNVPVTASVLLGGSGWQFIEPALDTASALQSYEGYSLLRPASDARWLLRDPDGAELSLRSAAYDQVPLDCTRAACHENLRGHTAGKMSDVLVRGLSGRLGADYSAECALACHALGEPGLEDGGFQHVASTLGVDVQKIANYAELPAALQRLSNVGCLSCHGPGAIPEPMARSRIQRSDVCAYCHDAPPRYGHVAAWQASAMSHTARRLTDRAREDCATCHTTSGFLRAQDSSERPAREASSGSALGLDCIVCHDVHQREPTPALLRSPKPPPTADHLDTTLFTSSRPCLNCHAPRAPLGSQQQAWPEASAAAIWLGRGGFATSGGPLTGPAVHAHAPEGCSSCHIGTASGLERGQNHGFQASLTACRRCHERPPGAPDHSSKARSLLALLVKREPALRELALPPETRPHTRPGKLDVNSPLGRAAYNLLLLLEDPAAGIHNPDYAQLLLDHAEGMLRAPPDESVRARDE